LTRDGKGLYLDGEDAKNMETNKTNKQPPETTTMTFLEHLRELRMRIFISALGVLAGSIVAFIFFNPLIALLFTPFQTIDSITTDKQLFINTLFEGFLTKLKISLLAGFILSFPVHLYNAVRFIFPALKVKEKRVIVIGLFISFGLLGFSFYYSYYNIIPLSVRFLTSRNFIPDQVGVLLNYNKNIFYILQFIFIALVIFQTPILLELLLVANVIKRKALLRFARYVMVGIFILSALLTPPDFISQVSLSVPLIALYFLTILVAKIFKFGEG